MRFDRMDESVLARLSISTLLAYIPELDDITLHETLYNHKFVDDQAGYTSASMQPLHD